LEIRELKSFVATVKHRSISKAAKQLELGQPTVTTHIKKLESELSVELLNRVTRPIKPTLNGQKFFELLEPLLEGLGALADKLKVAEVKGPVVIASTPDIIQHTLVTVVERFRSDYPDVHLKMVSTRRKEVIDLVKSAEVDIGVIQRVENSINLHFEALFPYERVLITPRDHPLLNVPLTSLVQIAEYPLILMSKGTYTRAILEEQITRRGVKADVVMELDSMDMIKKFVKLGLGISVGPKLALDEDDFGQLGVVPLSNLLPTDQAGIVTLPGKPVSKPTEWFVSVMRETLARHIMGSTFT